jgi:hypothetical protein
MAIDAAAGRREAPRWSALTGERAVKRRNMVHFDRSSPIDKHARPADPLISVNGECCRPIIRPTA